MRNKRPPPKGPDTAKPPVTLSKKGSSKGSPPNTFLGDHLAWSSSTQTQSGCSPVWDRQEVAGRAIVLVFALGRLG